MKLPLILDIFYKDCSVNLCDDESKFLAGETKANKKKRSLHSVHAAAEISTNLQPKEGHRALEWIHTQCGLQVIITSQRNSLNQLLPTHAFVSHTETG